MGIGRQNGARNRILVPGYAPRSKRAMRQTIVRMGIWLFLLLFVASILGVAVVSIRAR